MRSRSRIKSSQERQAKRNIFLSIFGMIALLVAIVVFGVPFLVNFSLFVEKKMDSKSLGQSKTDAYIPPPQLDISYTATNSGVIMVNGSGQEGQTVYLYVNNERVADTEVTSDSSFVFDDVHLQEGDNEIFTKAKVDNKSSDESNTLNITYIKDPPDISIDSPADGQAFSGGDNRTITVSGTTAENAKVTVNGFFAVMQPGGAFRYRLNLQDGDNELKIVAIDEANNKTEKNIKVTYSP
ncbi:MAG: hypothetical protein Q8Q49_00150 [bacterium]|nr:hypothetical protein [bacterium]